MAIPKTQETEILKIVAGLYNAAPGGSILTDFANLIEGGMTTRQLADALAAHSSFTNGIMAGKVTVEDQVDVLMANFGLVADEADPESAGSLAAAFFTEQLEAGVGFGELVFNAVAFLSTDPAPELFADAAALLNNKALVAELYSKEHSSNDLATLQSILAGVSASSPTTAEEAAAYLDSIGQGDNVGGTFALTFGADILTGGAGNDTFEANIVNNGAGTLVNSLENIDIVDGGDGRDTLNATLDAAAVTPVISNVEVLNIRAVTSSSVDFGDTTGAEQIWNNVSSSGTTLTYDNAPIAATFGIRNTKSETDINTFVDDVATGTADNLSLAVTSAGNDTTDAVVTSTTDAAGIETISIAATGENFVDVSAFTGITGLTITGAGSVNTANLIQGVSVAALETVNAADNSGGVTVDLTGALLDLTVTGGSGNDDITAGAGDDTIDAGVGDDRVAFATGTLDAQDTVAGGDADEDTLAIDGADAGELDATLQTGFEVLELTAGAGVTIDNTGFDFTKIVLAADVGGLTVDNLEAGTIEAQASQTGVTVTSVGDADSLDLAVNADAAVTFTAVDVTDVETVNVTTTADTDDTTFTLIETDGVSALSFAGAGDIIITAINDTDATNDATVKIANIDLTGQTGGFEMTANTLGYGTTFTLANLGATASANYDLDGDATNDEASELFGTLGFTDTFVFTTAFTGNVVIDDIEVGGDLTDDNIDLSALGLTNGIDDLVATDVAGGVVITSDAFEGQILLAGVTGAEVNVNDFIF